MHIGTAKNFLHLKSQIIFPKMNHECKKERGDRMRHFIFTAIKTLFCLFVLAGRIFFYLLQFLKAVIQLLGTAIYQAITKKADGDDLENWETVYDYGYKQD